eukprot:TRINITY_DN4303_c0_g1_i1.p1 TRINITY_DN4303_c0_g1~~TRINITY_DN4303_c0_g1_i1.p1  ORF type:complete len:333 (-),score=60.37 TRINITY_DN4303_c0_g1_i1:59-1057(-)
MSGRGKPNNKGQNKPNKNNSQAEPTVTGPGSHLKKATTSNQVINIIPPREVWHYSQLTRAKNLPNQRCGPHFSFVDPFVEEQHLGEAAELLKPVLKNIKPFKVILNKLNYFVNKTSCMLYAEPEFDPPTGLQDLLDAITQVFPHCNDQTKKSKNGKYVAHLSLSRFKDEKELLENKPQFEKDWAPHEFLVKEIYLLNRKGHDPFEVTHVIPLGDDTTPAYFGLGSPASKEDDESKEGRTVVVCGLPRGTTDDMLMKMLGGEGHKPTCGEICLNPGRELRTCGVVEFENRSQANDCLKFKSTKYPTVYINPLWKMVYPGTVGDCCSLNRKETN